VTVVRGRHNFKFGGLVQYNSVDFGGSNGERGAIAFSRDIRNVPDAFAAFMLFLMRISIINC
jgi:hypothetical protein